MRVHFTKLLGVALFRKSLWIGLLLLALQQSHGQDVFFSQYYANKPQLNPAMVGMRNCPVLSAGYKNQWPQLNQAYVSYTAQYEYYFREPQNALGLMLMQDNQGGGVLQNTSLDFVFSQRIQLARKLRMHLSLSSRLFARQLNLSQMVLPDMTGATDQLQATSETFGQTNIYGVDFNTGIFLYSPRFYAGAAFYHLNETNKIFSNLPAGTQPLRYSLQAGADFKAGGHNVSISPSAVAQIQGKYSKLSTGLYVKYKSFALGGWYHQNLGFSPQAITIMAGFVMDKFRFAYSSDFMLAPGYKKMIPSHEVSLSLFLNCLKREKQYEAISCPEF